MERDCNIHMDYHHQMCNITLATKKCREHSQKVALLGIIHFVRLDILIGHDSSCGKVFEQTNKTELSNIVRKNAVIENHIKERLSYKTNACGANPRCHTWYCIGTLSKQLSNIPACLGGSAKTGLFILHMAQIDTNDGASQNFKPQIAVLRLLACTLQLAPYVWHKKRKACFAIRWSWRTQHMMRQNIQLI